MGQDIIKLDSIDKRLISCLYHHYREPLTKIAKLCKISRDQVAYRLEKYEKEGLIRKYLTIFNYPLLGFNEFVIVWLRLKSTSESKKLIKQELENMKNVVSVGEATGNYDLFIDFVFKNKLEFEKVFYQFLKKHKANIDNYSIYLTTYAELFPLKSFGNLTEERNYPIVKSSESMDLGEKDIKILRVLEKNGRARIIDIAKQTGLSSELLVYKLRQLYKKGIVAGTRILFDMERLGFYFGILRIKLNDPSENIRERMIGFCKKYKHTNAISFGISDFNCIIQIFYQQEEELRQTLRDINEKFKGEIEKSDILLLEKEGIVKTFPL